MDRVVMFQGLEGYDDIRPGSTKVAVWNRGSDRTGESGQDRGDNEVEDFDIETPAYGMDFESEDLQVDDIAADSAAITEAVLRGEREDRFADAVALNAALRIYARGDADDIDAGLDAAREALDSGAAAATLEELQAF
jgi:anthranilate phosphoribosyltransferase